MFDLPKRMREKAIADSRKELDARNKKDIPESDPNHWRYDMPLFGQDKDEFMARQYKGKGE